MPEALALALAWLTVQLSMLAVTITTFIVLWMKASGQCVTFQFTEQPPRLLGCSPFQSNRWGLKLRCSVEKLSGSDTFDVRWFQRLSSGVVVDHGRPDLASSGESLNRAMFGGHWISKPFSGDMLGEYWCQVIRTTRQPYELLGISNTVTIREPAYYSLQSGCNNPVIDSSVVCADTAPVQPTSSSSTSSTVQLTSSSTFSSSARLPQTSSKHSTSSSTHVVASSSSSSLVSTSTFSITSISHHSSSSSQVTMVSSSAKVRVTPNVATSSSLMHQPTSMLHVSSNTIQHTSTSTVAANSSTVLAKPTATITAVTTTRPAIKTSYKNAIESPSSTSKLQLPPSGVTNDIIKESEPPIQLWFAIAALAVIMIMLIVTVIVLVATTIMCSNKKGSASKESKLATNATSTATENDRSYDRLSPALKTASLHLYDEVQAGRYVQPNNAATARQQSSHRGPVCPSMPRAHSSTTADYMTVLK